MFGFYPLFMWSMNDVDAHAASRQFGFEKQFEFEKKRTP